MASPFNPPPREFEARISKPEARLVAELLSLYRSCYDFAQDFFDDAETLNYAYDAYVDPATHNYKYNPVVPLVFTLVEDISSTIVNAFMERDRIVDVNPTEGIHSFRPDIRDEDVARQLQTVLNSQLLHPDTNLINEVLDFIKQAAMYGNTYSTALPRFERREDRLVYLGPKIKPQDYFNVLGDPSARRLTEGRFIQQIEHVSFKELRKRERNEHYFNTIQVKNDRWIGDDRHDEIFQTVGRLSKHFQSETEESGPINLIHTYLKGHIITLANGRVIVRDTRRPIDLGDVGRHVVKPYPYEIWDEFVFYPKPLERYGKGVAHIVAKYQDEINLFKRMRLEAIELTLKPVIMADLGFDIPVDMLIAAPGNIWDVPKDALDIFQFTDNTQSSYAEQQFNMAQAEQAAGLPGIVQGQRPPRRTQASTELNLQRNAQKKSTTIMKRFALWAQSVIRKQVIQMHLWMDQSDYERIIGEPDAGFYALSTEEVMRLYDFNLTSTALDATKEVEKATFIQFAQWASQFPEIANVRQILMDGSQMFFPTKSPERYVLQQQLPNQQENLQTQGAVPGERPTAQQELGQPTIPAEQIRQGNLLQ